MLTDTIVVAASLAWLGLLFGAAVWGERRGWKLDRHWGTVYALSLAVYCTSWTFYGTVTQAARSGWPLPPTFVGTILLYVFGAGLLVRLIRLSREHNSSSIADLIATRLGRNSWLAATVTGVALLGLIPYVALQLKAVAMSYSMLTRASELSPPVWGDSALYVALAMAVFAMLFGTRSASAVEHNRGLVLAVAVESLFKLGVMLALGAFVVFGPHWPAPPLTPEPGGAEGFPALIMLGVLVMFTLPHQFHVGVVECRDERHLHTARWMFPLYMVLIALPLLPLARVGLAQLAPLGVPSDLYVLALPLSQGQGGLALLAFLGGLSAATGMVILATLSLSLMIGNHWLAPLRVRGAWAQPGGPNRRGEVLLQRRVGILAVVLLAWLYSRAIAGSEALADIGAVSFSALSTIAPALGFAMWRPRTSPLAVLVGMLFGVGVWVWTLLLPTLWPLAVPDAAWLERGPVGLAFLAPDGFLGLTGWSRVLRAVVTSLVVATLLPLLIDWLWRRKPDTGAAGPIPVAALQDLAGRFLHPLRMEQLFEGANGDGYASARLQSTVERELASVLGAASTRLLIDTARTDLGPDLETVAAIVGEASQVSRFNQRLLEAALENMSQGISVVDRDQRLVAWNRRYAELFGFPSELLHVGQPVETLAHWALSRGFGSGREQLEQAVSRRIEHMRAGTPHLSERRFPDGTVVEIRGNPMPGGGFVATFTDVTQFRRAEAELTRANETLEMRVDERTRELDQARRAAERANEAKSRFLAAISHDLLQPLHAAQLFTHALGERLQHEQYRALVDNIHGALDSTEALLGGLLDISRLDAGRQPIDVQDFPLAQLLEPMAAEFEVMAAERGVVLDLVPSAAWVRSDPQLLRRVLMNFVSNAVRYTERGRIVIGSRRRGNTLRIEVWDTGPGIAERERRAIFDEFRRGDQARGQGLGLGLAIAERTARLLGHPLRLRSWPGHGSVFSVSVPRAAPGRLEQAPATLPEAPDLLTRSTVLVLDNDAVVREAMRELLEGWSWCVHAAHDIDSARAVLAAHPVDLLLLDYHLDGDTTGLDAHVALASTSPAIVITADRSEAVREAVEARGLLLLHKPLRPLALRSVMRRLGL
ncbi:PAS-domain containing protein [Xanthomonadaceae bacterium JHOS43]|nr:PAS-domain containing protein [Xanthomonadaceae bacterium JHOS43]MCX7564329.1 PAS-domain containing protein [Xanthomonadaceae bacterium XH05]